MEQTQCVIVIFLLTFLVSLSTKYDVFSIINLILCRKSAGIFVRCCTCLSDGCK